MKNPSLLFVLAGLLGACPVFGQAPAQSVEVHGPDGRVVFRLQVDATGQLIYEVTREGRAIIQPSRLGIKIDGQSLGTGAALGEPTRREIHETYRMVSALQDATNHCHEGVVPITSGPAKITWTLEVRVFNDGAAYRYRVPGNTARHLDGEDSAWQLPDGAVAFFQEASRPDYETPFREATLDTMTVKPGVTLAAPITFQLPEGGFAAITEANLTGYSDMTLAPLSGGGFHAVFPNDPEGWAHEGEIVTPWRVTLVAPDLTTLVNSNILPNLCPEPAPELVQATWIQPGRSTWHWMVTRQPKLPDQRQWIDWTRQLGFEYYLIDDGWNRWAADGKDHWECMREVVEYATSQNVKVWVWLHVKDIPDAATRQAWFAKASGMGIVGVKVDFPQPANVAWVQWYDDILRDAAQARLMINFHGAIKPTGRARTWPNELTREALRGNEHRKADVRTEVILPFTRLLQGPADFTPTDFRADYISGRSWPHELAQAIVFASPLLCFDGSPDDYLESEARDLIQAIPATWDETVVLPATGLGTTAAIARRKGGEWFIGVLNSAAPRPVEIKLGFLGPGSYALEQFSDSLESETAWERKQSRVGATDTLRAQMRGAGGFVARLSPAAPSP